MMSFFSQSQDMIYDSAKDLIIQRLETILEHSESTQSKEAFFFILMTIPTHKTEKVEKLINTFYENKTPIINKFLLELNGWIKDENKGTKFIKAITDPRFIAENNNNPEYVEQLQKEFATKIAQDVKNWLETKLPHDFKSIKYSLLRKKHALDSEDDEQKIIASSGAIDSSP